MNKKKYTDSEMRKLYEGSFCNEDEMQRYIMCACFSCGKKFLTSDICDWVIEDDGKKSASPFGDLLNQDAINRFDKKKKKKKKKSGEKPAGPKSDKPAGPKAEKPAADDNVNAKGGGNNGGGNNNGGGGNDRRPPRQGKPKRFQQEGQQPEGERPPRKDKPQRMEKKTFRPRKPKDAGAPDNGNGKQKPNKE